MSYAAPATTTFARPASYAPATTYAAPMTSYAAPTTYARPATTYAAPITTSAPIRSAQVRLVREEGGIGLVRQVVHVDSGRAEAVEERHGVRRRGGRFLRLVGHVGRRHVFECALVWNCGSGVVRSQSCVV